MLFDFYSSLSTRPLEEALRDARIRFPVSGRDATTLVISHARRRYLNMQRNLKDKPPGAIFFRAPVTGNANGTGPQSMFLWPGIHVIGAGPPLKKGVFETVLSVTSDEVVLHNGTRLTAHQAVRSLKLAYALTYPSCQGLTIPGVVRLDCTANIHFTLKHLYVGSSRCTARNLLEVA